MTLLRSDRAFTDCRPLSLISAQTVQHLGREVGADLDARRSRPNVYVDLTGGQGYDAAGGLGFCDQLAEVGGRLADRLSPRQATLTFAAIEVGIALSARLSETVLYDWLPSVGHLGLEAPWGTFLWGAGRVAASDYPDGRLTAGAVEIGSACHRARAVGPHLAALFANTLGGAVAAVATAFLFRSRLSGTG